MLGKLGALVLTLSLATPAAALADETTEPAPEVVLPHVNLDPCPNQPVGEACSQRQFATVVSFFDDPEGLAVAGASLDGDLVYEHVYDDGSGFTPYGEVWLPFNDGSVPADHYAGIEVPPGVHEVTFHARDLEGNERAVTRSVIGAKVPTRVTNVRATQRGRSTLLQWSFPRSRGSWVYQFRIRVPGVGMHRITGHVPSKPWTSLRLPRLEPGRHVARITAVSWVGESRARSFVFRVR